MPKPFAELLITPKVVIVNTKTLANEQIMTLKTKEPLDLLRPRFPVCASVFVIRLIFKRPCKGIIQDDIIIVSADTAKNHNYENVN